MPDEAGRGSLVAGRWAVAPMLVLLLLGACSKREGTIDLIKTVASEARTKPRIELSIRMNGEQPAADDLALQKSIEDKIEAAHLGRLVSSGTESGFMTITVEVENSADAITKLRAILLKAGVLSRSAFKVSQEGKE